MIFTILKEKLTTTLTINVKRAIYVILSDVLKCDCCCFPQILCYNRKNKRLDSNIKKLSKPTVIICLSIILIADILLNSCQNNYCTYFCKIKKEMLKNRRIKLLIFNIFLSRMSPLESLKNCSKVSYNFQTI